MNSSTSSNISLIDYLAPREYLGRVLMLGRCADGEHNVLAYALTGRSGSSRARTLQRREDGSIHTQVTDASQLAKGNPSLLLYDCIRREQGVFLASNGAQTTLLQQAARRLVEAQQPLMPLQILTNAFAQPHWVDGNSADELIDLTTFEPDAPNDTPRISGALGRESAALTVVKRATPERTGGLCAARLFLEYPLVAGKGRLVSTYAGANVGPGAALPSFPGEPVEVCIEGNSPQEIAESIYRALGPKEEAEGIVSPGQDFRVAVAVLCISLSSHRIRHHIINRAERKD